MKYKMEWIVLFLLFILIQLAGAAVPTIDTIIINQSSYNPTENSTTTVKVNFNVTDLDGTANLNNSACQCEFDNSQTWQALYESASDTSCDNQTINANTTQYTCLVDMQFWFENNTYSVNVTVKDNETSVSNATETFTYTVLIASVLDTTTIDFGTITSSDYGTNKTDSNSPTTITNTGNQVLSLKITGAELSDSTGLSPNISVSDFYVKNDSSVSGSLQLSSSQQTIPNATVPVEDSASGGNTEDIWWFFSMPNTFRPGTYSGIWTLVEE